jgi:phospholipid/cholesterol/gamma-HCH transport system permease protein
MVILDGINFVGQTALSVFTEVGSFVLFLATTIKALFTTRFNWAQFFLHMKRIGVDSFSIIFLTGLSSGLALALQIYIGFHRFGIEEFIGTIVALGMTRELGPVLTGLMVTGRAGSAMAAEIGTMQITEQVDALKTLCINPYQYLIVPRMMAGIVILPFLTIFSMLCGIIGGYIYCVYVVELNADSYVSSIRQWLEMSDITGGLIKSSFFGLILSWVGSYTGYHTHGGARGVGIATTRSVVMGSIMILIANYFLSSFLHTIGVS